VFFVILAILGPLLAFLFGRVLDIKTFVHVCAANLVSLSRFSNFEQNQRMEYHEVLIAGDLSQEDVARASNQLGAFEVTLQQLGLSPTVLTVSRVLPKRGLCSRMARAPLTTSNTHTVTKLYTSPNQVYRNSCLAVLGLVLSIPIKLHH